MRGDTFSCGKIHFACILIILITVLTAGGDGLASPWGRENGEVLLIGQAEYFSTSPPNSSGSLPGAAQFIRVSSMTYAEYGVTDDVMLGGKVVYGSSWSGQSGSRRQTSGVSELQFFAQQRVYSRSKDVGAVRLSLARPSQLSAGARTELASDKIDAEVAFLYGRNLRSSGPALFLTTEAGFKKRWGLAADQVRANVGLGIEPTRRILILVDAASELSLHNEAVDGPDYDVLKLSTSIVWQASNKLHLQAGLTEEVLGRNLQLGRAFQVGFWVQF